MLELATFLPALGAPDGTHLHGWWWIVLAAIVFVLVSPLAYFWGRHGGRPGT